LRAVSGLDIVGAAVGLVVLAPLLVLAAAAIKWTSRGPVIFSQLRSGHGGKQFRIYKFRSGPRPLPCDETAGCNRWQRRRLAVPPGLTCIWQVTGRSQVSFDDWARMDIRYIRTRALANDVKLILQTFPAVLLRRGAH
jgi:lipopolysaccharide/colanic/teichoic acid biosynthesis glycosyltransferase